MLFFIEVATRRLYLTRATRNPDASFVTQQGRNVVAFDLAEAGAPIRVLVHDRDSKYTRAFDEVFTSEGARVILSPFRAPKANSFAERVVRTIRWEILDWTLVLGRRHLDRLLRDFARHYNSERPHRGLALAVPEVPISPEPLVTVPMIERRDRLSGLIHEYYAVAV